ncbi:MAG: hypothetical protein ABS948_05325 [Solibacillus sp.]
MNIFIKAGNERIFGVPFQYEQLTVANRQTEHTQLYKLILNTEHTDLPFHQVIFTMPYVSEFEQMLNVDQQLYKQQMIIDMVHPKLCVNTFCHGEFFGSQFFDVLTGRYLLSAHNTCSETELTALQCEYKGFVVEADHTVLQA